MPIFCASAVASHADNLASPHPATLTDSCKAGNQVLFYSVQPQLDARTAPGFSDSLMHQLDAPLKESGYCLETPASGRAPDTSRFGDNFVLHVLVEGDAAVPTLLAALLRAREMAQGKLPEAVSHPLVSLRFSPSESAGLPGILARKIAENLRSQYVADLLVRTRPPGAVLRVAGGPEGVTPAEWVVPLGNLHVTLEMPGYLPLHRDIDLASPGSHSFEFQLDKRRFYHSGFIYPTAAAGALSLAAFLIENRYYSAYQALGAQDARTRPQAFGDDFHAAKASERVAYAALGLSALGLGLCFAF